MLYLRGVALVLCICCLTACQLFQFQGSITKTTTKNGETKTEHQEFDDWGEMKTALKAEWKAMRAFTVELSEKLIEDMIEAPPPGEVKLADLSPGLEKFSDAPGVDFLAEAKARGDEDFVYVQIGVPSYDHFFKAVAEFYAFTYELEHAILELRVEAKAALEGKVEVKGMSLLDLGLAATRGEVAVEAAAQARVQGLVDLTTAIARSAPDYVMKVQELVAAGQELVTAAPTSILNPKTLVHLDLIVRGLEQSVVMVTASGKLVVEMAREVGSFASRSDAEPAAEG